MKKRMFFGALMAAVLLVLVPAAAEAKTDRGIPVTSKYFSDKGILKKAKKYDKDQDGYLSPEEIGQVTDIRCTMDVADLSQLKYFTALNSLWIDAKNMSRYDGKTLDFTVFPKLEHISLVLDYEKPTSAVPDVKVKVSGLKELSSFQIHNWYVDRNGKKGRKQFVDTIDLRDLPSLTVIYMNGVKGLIFDDDSEIEQIEVKDMTEASYDQIRKLTQLERLVLWSDDPKSTALDVSDNPFIRTLNIHNSYLKEIRLAGLEGLESLSITGKSLEELDLSQNKKLKRMHLSCAKLGSLDLTQNTKLYRLYLSSKKLDTLDITKNPSLKYLTLKTDRLKALDTSENEILKNLKIASGALAELDLENNGMLQDLDISAGQLSALDLSGNRALWRVTIQDTKLKSLDLSEQGQIYGFATINNQALVRVNLPQKWRITSLTIEDTPWKTDLFEFEKLGSLTLGGVVGAWKGGRLPSGIGRLTIQNMQISSVDLSQMERLEDLEFHGNKKVTTLDLSKNPGLFWIDVSDNALKTLKLGTKKSLRYVNCKNNKLKTLDLSGASKSCNVYCDKDVKVTGFQGKVNKN